jgi:hypothetical protein
LLYNQDAQRNAAVSRAVPLFEGLTNVDIGKYVDFQTWYNRDKEIYKHVEAKELEQFFQRVNAYYSTRLNTKKIAEKIMEWDNLTSMGVDQFVDVCYKQTQKRAYSFATKVFNFIDGKKFPIIDKYVVTLLEYYLNRGEQDNSTWNKSAWNKYESYLRAYDSFKLKYHLTELSYKETDVFLWAYGSAIQKYWKENGVLSFESVSYTYNNRV